MDKKLQELIDMLIVGDTVACDGYRISQCDNGKYAVYNTNDKTDDYTQYGNLRQIAQFILNRGVQNWRNESIK
jgi:hypothetical protein